MKALYSTLRVIVAFGAYFLTLCGVQAYLASLAWMPAWLKGALLMLALVFNGALLAMSWKTVEGWVLGAVSYLQRRRQAS